MFRKKVRRAARKYLAGLLVYSLVMFLYSRNGYHRTLLTTNTLTVLRSLYFFYLFAGLPFNLLTNDPDKSKPEELLEAVVIIGKNAGWFVNGFLPGKKRYKKNPLSKRHKTVVFFALVKVFYTPLMLNFFFSNFYSVTKNNWLSFDFRADYTKLFSLIFMIDTLFFSFGYLFEHKRLGNMVKSVEPTVLGWGVALMSYPPFNSVSTRYLGWYSGDYFYFSVEWVDFLLKALVVGLLLLYLWATFSLGTKCSNLTNRGIVNKGAYKYIRHPAYTGKVLAWWIMALSNLSWGMLLSMLAWTTVYFMRAITEERHLIKDKDYREYVKQTPYRFLPGWV